MMKRNPGSALRLRILPLAIGLLTSCGQQPAATKPEPVKTARQQVDEVDALVSAMKQHPSLAKAKDAGAPIHVDPYPHSKGAPPHHMHMAK
jgi:hypothetical protein